MATRAALEGRTLGEFLLREKIGEGGFAAVYRAYQAALEREAVVKVLHAQLSSRSDVTQRFLRESRLASRLDHPFAAHVYAFGAEPDGTLWIAMELVRGMPMDKLLDEQGPLSLDRFVPLFERICEVVQTAHERGIVHRDLKPGNVMVLSRAGRLLPKLLDFGIARVLEETQKPGDPSPLDHTVLDAQTNVDHDAGRPTRAGAVMGSPLYMAPEQWADAGSVGQAADIYALGVVAYEALTGRHPFTGTTVHSVMVAHATADPDPLGPGLEALDPVIARALAKRPEDRYATAGDLAAAIRGVTGRGDADVLPELDEAVRVTMAASAPQPLAEAVAALETARNIDQACALVWDAVSVTAHWLGTLALAARTKIGPGGETDAHDATERLRALGRGDVADDDWIELARALTRPFFRRRDAYPVPDLVGVFHGDTDLATTPPDGALQPGPTFVEAFRRLRSLRGTLDRRAGKTDEQRRELYAEALVALAELLRPLRFLLDYTVIVTRKTRAERWRGMRRTPRPALVRRARPLPEGDAYLLDADGQPVLALSPLVQVATPAPGKDEELFLFAGHGAHGGRLVAVPYGFELHDLSLDDWFRENLFDLARDAGDRVADEVAPYRGLAPFTAEESAFYFGREREIETVVNRLRVEAFIAVVGPSGAGKSSFVQAGLIPRFPTSWRAIVVRPGGSPAAALAARLERNAVDGSGLADDPRGLGERLRMAAAREGSTIVLVVDQLEELFTLCHDAEQRNRYAEALADAARSDEDAVRVVVTLRDDFLIRAEALGPLHERLARGLKLLTTPAAEDLERILVEPARRVGYQFEDRALVTEMVAEVTGQPGALALLSFTAAELWKLRDRHFHQLARKSYTAIGGVGGALARHAETMLGELSPEEQRVAREAFRHLVTAEGTRQVLQLAELRQLLKRDGVVDKLVAARLVVVSEEAGGEDRVEIIHEALLDAWPRLVEWRREDSEGARLRDQLRAAAKQWEARSRPSGLLWRGDALAEYQIWRSRYPGTLTDVETAFADASVAEATQARRNRRLLVASAFGVLVAGVVGLVVLNTRIAGQRRELQVTLQRQYEDQGRRLVLANSPLEALAYLAKASELGAGGSAHDFLVAQAVRATDGELYEVRHDNRVSSAAFSPDGRRLVTTSTDKRARIWDARTGDLLRTLPATETMSSASFSPDGTQILTASLGGSAFVWDAATGQRIREVSLKRPVKCSQFSSDGELAMAAGDGDTLVVWERTSGRERVRVHGDGAGLTACTLSQDGMLVAAGDNSGTTWIWDARTGALRHELRGQHERIRTIEFTRDGGRLVTASMDKTAIEWDTATGARMYKFEHAGPVRSARFSPDGRSIVTASSDRTAVVWDALVDGKPRFPLSGHSGGVEAVAFSPDGAYIVTGSEDATARLWDAATGRTLARWLGHQDSIGEVVFDQSGQSVVTTGADGTAIVWRVAPQQRVTWLERSETEPAINAAVSPDGDRILMIDGDSVRLWDARTGRRLPGEIRETESAQRPIGGLGAGAPHVFDDALFSPDARSILTGGERGVALWSVATGAKLRTFSSEAAWAVDWSQDGSSVLALSRAGMLRCWDARTGRLRFENRPHGKSLAYAATFDATGTQIVSTGADSTSRIWSLDGRQLLARSDLGTPITAVFDPTNGTRVMSVVSRQQVKIWRLLPDVDSVELVGHTAKVYDARWSPDGTRAVTSSADGTVRIWDTSDGNELAQLVHPGRARVGWLSRDGRRILIAGEDGSAALYDLPHYEGQRDELERLLRCRVPFVVRGDGLATRPRDRRGCSGL